MEVRIHRNPGDLEIISRSMGEWHSIYAHSAVENGAYVVELHDGGLKIGQAVVYSMDVGRGYRAGVIYYIAIDEVFRGRGYGLRLLTQAEAFLAREHGANVYLASTSIDNEASINLFRSAGYTQYTWEEIYREYGEKTADTLLRIMCSYEDEVVFIKTRGESHRVVLENMARAINRKAVREWWYRTCYKPWASRIGKTR